MTDNTMAKRKRTKGQIMIYKTLHRKQRIEQHEHDWGWTPVNTFSYECCITYTIETPVKQLVHTQVNNLSYRGFYTVSLL